VLTASVVLYHTPRQQIETLFASVIASKCVSTLYVIDNSSNDKWRILEREYENQISLHYIHNENLGYGASHNLAMQEAIEKGSIYHVVLNPDIQFESPVLPTLINFMNDNPDAGYVLPKVIYTDGEIQYLCKLLPTPSDLIFRRFLPQITFTEQINKRYTLQHSGYDRIMNPPCLSGCFMFLRLSTMVEHQIFFDDGYFMYCEDFDLIRRLHRVSKTLFYPEVTIIHNHAKSSYKNKKMLFAHIKSAIRYFNKFGWFFDKKRRLMNQRFLNEVCMIEKNKILHERVVSHKGEVAA